MKTRIKSYAIIIMVFCVTFSSIPCFTDIFNTFAASSNSKKTPIKLSAEAVGYSGASLEWKQINKKIDGYAVFRNGKRITRIKVYDTTAPTYKTYDDYNLEAGTRYKYQVKAYRKIIKKTRKWFNKATGKWQNKKPPKKKRGKTKVVKTVQYKYSNASNIVEVRTKPYVEGDNLWTSYAAKKFASGKGTKKNPYKISTAGQLALVSKLLAGSNSKKYQNAYYELVSDIDLKKHVWVPIGGRACESSNDNFGGFGLKAFDSGKFFQGNFNGNHHTISNIRIEPVKDVYDYGLFSDVCSATIKNITIENVSIQGHFDMSSPLIGALAANVSNYDNEPIKMSNVNNCIVTGVDINVRGSSVTCGGLIGQCSDCYLFDSSVSGSISVKDDDCLIVSGLSTDSYMCEIRNCSFSGNIVSDSKKDAFVTGFIQPFYETTSIINCFCSASVNSTFVGDGATYGFMRSDVYYSAGFFKNLVFTGEVIENQEKLNGCYAIFESPSWPIGEFEYFDDEHGYMVCQNLIEVVDDNVYWYCSPSADMSDNQSAQIYENVQDYGELFKNDIGFSSDDWAFSKTEQPKLKPHSNSVCDHAYYNKSRIEGVEESICIKCGKLHIKG